jgi:hypothetical protein
MDLDEVGCDGVDGLKLLRIEAAVGSYEHGTKTSVP